MLVRLDHVALADKKNRPPKRGFQASSLILTSLPQPSSGSNDAGGGGSKLDARDTSGVRGRNNTGMVENKSNTASCSTHRDNNYNTSDSRHNSRPEIQNLLPELRTSERQKAAQEQKPIHLPLLRLRAFSSVFSLRGCWFASEVKPQGR